MILPLNLTGAPVENTILFNKYNYVKATLNTNLKRYQDYLRCNSFSADGENILMGVLNTLDSYLRDTPAGTYQAIQDDEDRIANLFNITTDLNIGKVEDNGFFGPEVEEVIYLRRDDLMFTDFSDGALLNWEDVEAIEVVTHPVDNITLYTLDNELNNSATGIAVMSLDIALLGAQYHAWLNSLQENNITGRMSNFIIQYPVGNMLSTYLKIATFNRFQTALLKGSPCTMYHKSPFRMLDITDKLDAVHDEIISALTKTRPTDTQVMTTIPVMNSTASTLIMDINLTTTRQAMWIHLITWLPYLVVPGTLTHGDREKHLGAKIKKILGKFKSSNGITACPSPAVKQELERLITTVSTLYKI